MTRVGIYQPPEGEPGGETHPDPYFGGAGPERTTCSACGGCMMGCRYNAKNTLDKNYLYFAEKHRRSNVFPETKVVDVICLNGKADGSDGYEVRTVKSTAWLRKQPRRFTCRGVVFAGSALGSMDLLFRLKQKGSLPAISDQLGHRVRTNAESMIGVRVPDTTEDLSKGVAIGSGIHLDEYTHIEAVRYPEGSDSHGVVVYAVDQRPARLDTNFADAQKLRDGAPSPPYPDRALPASFRLGTRVAHPAVHANARRSHRYAPGAGFGFGHSGRVLVTSGQRIPTYIPQANEFAMKAAQMVGRHADEHGHRNPVRYSQYGAHSGWLRRWPARRSKA